MEDFQLYFSLGWSHIISWGAWDHILFIVALTVVCQPADWKQVLILVTAFTVGHALTLALSVFDLIRFSTPWVEFLIPCTIACTAVSNLLLKGSTSRSIRVSYILALSFGLIHGMGFANAIRFMLAQQEQIGWPLFGFNLGLEIGQIFVVLLVLGLSILVPMVPGLSRRRWVVLVSAAIFCLGVVMAWNRIP